MFESTVAKISGESMEAFVKRCRNKCDLRAVRREARFEIYCAFAVSACAPRLQSRTQIPGIFVVFRIDHQRPSREQSAGSRNRVRPSVPRLRSNRRSVPERTCHGVDQLRESGSHATDDGPSSTAVDTFREVIG